MERETELVVLSGGEVGGWVGGWAVSEVRAWVAGEDSLTHTALRMASQRARDFIAGVNMRRVERGHPSVCESVSVCLLPFIY